jgi:hypothetical protein
MVNVGVYKRYAQQGLSAPTVGQAAGHEAE